MTGTVSMTSIPAQVDPGTPTRSPSAGPLLRAFGFRAREESFDVLDPRPLPGTRDRLAARAEATLADAPPDHRVVGALPFEPDDAWLGCGPAVRPHLPSPVLSTVEQPAVRCVIQEPGAAFRRRVRAALHRIVQVGDLQKVVLSRGVRIDFERAPDAGAVLGALIARHPTAWSFSVRLGGSRHENGDQHDGSRHENDAPTSWIGASPELLLRKRGRSVSSVPLAGSAARHPNRRMDDEVRRALAASTKDRREHALVVEAIADTLAPHCTRLRVPPEPTPMPAGSLWHLGTSIVGELRDPNLSSLALADELHPTPALGGWPRAAARQAITDLEDEPRGLYGGAVGWCDATGDGTWVVAIRCARLTGRTLWARAGAGIVDGSDPEAELAETNAKLGTVLAAVGLRPQDLG